MPLVRSLLVWLGLALAIGIPLTAAAFSPLLAWREPIYIVAGFAGIAGLCILLLQPLLIQGALPGLSIRQGRRLHPWLGGALVGVVIVHVGGLWLTSPPDVIDALLLVSPTPFSLWGVIAMWAAFAAALLALFRRRWKLRWKTWRLGHLTLTAMVVAGTVAHTLLIEGTMESISKVVLCGLVVVFGLRALAASIGGVRR